jgi:amidase
MTTGRSPIDRGITSGIWSRRRAYYAALSRRDDLATAMDGLLADYDALVCPVAATPAFTHRRTGASIAVDDADVPYMMAAAAFATVFNLTGHPAVVLPIGRTEDGLPLGVQVVGRRWADRSLLATAAAIDDAVDGYARPPVA